MEPKLMYDKLKQQLYSRFETLIESIDYQIESLTSLKSEIRIAGYTLFLMDEYAKYPQEPKGAAHKL